MFPRITLAMMLIVSLALVGFVRAADEKLSKDDKEIIKDAMRELEAIAQDSRIARTNSNSDGVQHFAELVLKDHDRMIKELHELGNKYDFAYDADPTRPDVKDKKELEKLKGQEFDRQYMSTAWHELEQLMDMFKKGEKTDNKELRGWFKRNMDEVKRHEDNARELYKKVKAKDKD